MVTGIDVQGFAAQLVNYFSEQNEVNVAISEMGARRRRRYLVDRHLNACF